jgi:CheY-like chemotaxis protein
MPASKVAKMTDKNRILIVDDDDVVRQSYLRSLESTSCQVAAASDGEEALQTMEQNPFDVVLLDMRMPGQDGLSVLRTAKPVGPQDVINVADGAMTRKQWALRRVPEEKDIASGARAA